MKSAGLLLKVCIATFGFVSFFSCTRLIEVDVPHDQVVAENIFADDQSATAAVVGIYSEMIYSSQLFSAASTTLYAGLSADELYHYSGGTYDEFLDNQLTPKALILNTGFWQPAYKFIYAINSCLLGIESSGSLSPGVKSKLLGECRFLRAFCYFYLTNLFGPVPLALGTNYEENAILSRNSVDEVYDQIISDLLRAEELLPPTYSGTLRTRVNKYAASALLARVYLYLGRWEEAKSKASEVINSGVYGLNHSLNQTFKKASNETIWQLYPINPNNNTWEGSLILPASSGSTPGYLITDSLLNAFETADSRKDQWILSRVYRGQTIYYPGKYKIRTGTEKDEFYVMLRLSEQYLIRAEAEAELNELELAADDLNQIRSKAGLTDFLASNQDETIRAIRNEWRIEFMFEWGHRWLDLKRWNLANEVLGEIKGANWSGTDQLWPIPESEILLNSHLTQNPGY